MKSELLLASMLLQLRQYEEKRKGHTLLTQSIAVLVSFGQF